MKEYNGIRMWEMAPSEIENDRDLLTQVITLTRVERFLWGNEGHIIDPDRMRSNYGDLLCDNNLQALVDEVWRRKENGSDECARFLTRVTAAIERSWSHPRNRPESQRQRCVIK